MKAKKANEKVEKRKENQRLATFHTVMIDIRYRTVYMVPSRWRSKAKNGGARVGTTSSFF